MILFLPAAGFRNGASDGGGGRYWSSDAVDAFCGFTLLFTDESFYAKRGSKVYRYGGYIVRLAAVVSESAGVVFCSCLLREPGLVLTSVM